MRGDEPCHLGALLRQAGPLAGRAFHGRDRDVSFADIAQGTMFGAADALLAGRNVLVTIADPLIGGLSLIELDGLAARIVVCAPGLHPDHRAEIARRAEAEIVVHDGPAGAFGAYGLTEVIPFDAPRPASPGSPRRETDWLLLTSGTTGVPKIVSHSLRGLTGAIAPPTAGAAPPVWATFYDIRRYGGLQIFLRALLGSGSMVLPGLDEALPDLLTRMGARGVTHVSGTPSHWRRVLMDPNARAMAPLYVRLSGEIADQAILDALAAFYPQAKVGHAYASTEAGVGFEVTDGREGFPACYVAEGVGPVAMRIEEGTLRIRSARAATSYVGSDDQIVDADGFVDTGDAVALRGDRFFFEGRRGGIINVGGQKAHPEEIEAVLNAHRAVRMSLVRSRRNPITGAVVSADVVLGEAGCGDPEAARRALQDHCREHLAAWKVPATIRFVPSLEVTAAGKLARRNA